MQFMEEVERHTAKETRFMGLGWHIKESGSAITQAVTCRLSGFDPRYGQVGFEVDEVEMGLGFFQALSFPCQLTIQQLLHIHQSSYHPTQRSIDTESAVKWAIQKRFPFCPQYFRSICYPDICRRRRLQPLLTNTHAQSLKLHTSAFKQPAIAFIYTFFNTLLGIIFTRQHIISAIEELSSKTNPLN
jgi:hypothetical protein